MIQILILAKHSYTLTMVKSERKAGLLLHLAPHFCFMSNFCSARAIGKITFLSVNASKTNFLTTKEILHEQNNQSIIYREVFTQTEMTLCANDM